MTSFALTQKKIIGSWALKSYVIHRPSGKVIPWAKRPRGLLIYTAEKTMSASINSSGDRRGVFYSGGYRIADGKVFHHVEQSSDPSLRGKTLTRAIQYHNEQLTLSEKGKFGTAVLVWTRRK